MRLRVAGAAIAFTLVLVFSVVLGILIGWAAELTHHPGTFGHPLQAGAVIGLIFGLFASIFAVPAGWWLGEMVEKERCPGRGRWRRDV